MIRASDATANRLFLVVAAAAGVVLLALGAGLTFFSDEWAFIESRALGDPGTWFAPHNEHWATLQVLAYRAMVETVGLRSYLPYLALLIALHLVVASLVFVLVRRSSGGWAGLVVAGAFALFGAGFENLYWAFQIGFVGALAFGLAGLLVLDANPLTGGRAFAGAVLLLAALATQGGPGLIFTLATAIELVLDPARRRWLIVLAIPTAIYVAWYLAIGRVGIEAHEGIFSLGSADVVAAVIARGWTTTVGAVAGVGPAYGGFMIVAAVVAFALWSIRSRQLLLSRRFVAMVGAITALYALIGLARSFVGPDVAQYTRYTYISAALLIVGVAAQVGRPRFESRAARRAVLVGGGLVLTLAIAWNVRLLLAGRDLFFERTELTRAFVTVALERPLPATTDPDRTLVIIPSPNAMERIVGAYGSPLTDSLVPWAVPPVRPEILDLAREVLAEGAEIPLPDR